MKRKKINKRKKKAFACYARRLWSRLYYARAVCVAVVLSAPTVLRCVRSPLADCFRDWLRCPGVTPCRVCLARCGCFGSDRLSLLTFLSR